MVRGSLSRRRFRRGSLVKPVGFPDKICQPQPVYVRTALRLSSGVGLYYRAALRGNEGRRSLGQCSDSLDRQWRAFYIGAFPRNTDGTNIVGLSFLAPSILYQGQEHDRCTVTNKAPTVRKPLLLFDPIPELKTHRPYALL